MIQRFDLSHEQSKWLSWCHAEQELHVAQSAINAVTNLARVSPYNDPLLIEVRQTDKAMGAGYLLMCEGALGILGNLRCTSQTQESAPSSTSNLAESEMLVELIDGLCQKALERGAEIVQAIVPITDVNSHDPVRDNAFERAGLKRITRLVQMECLDLLDAPMSAEPHDAESHQLKFIPHQDVSWSAWCQIVELTYQQTRDVPELNGLRSTHNTLMGYASGHPWPPKNWWVVRKEDEDIGCLLLTRIPDTGCELTYAGIVPEARGKGLGQAIMSFIRSWMIEQHRSRISLAVDVRNTPAIALYKACGFQSVLELDAWFRCK